MLQSYILSRKDIFCLQQKLFAKSVLLDKLNERSHKASSWGFCSVLSRCHVGPTVHVAAVTSEWQSKDCSGSLLYGATHLKLYCKILIFHAQTLYCLLYVWSFSTFPLTLIQTWNGVEPLSTSFRALQLGKVSLIITQVCSRCWSFLFFRTAILLLNAVECHALSSSSLLCFYAKLHQTNTCK